MLLSSVSQLRDLKLKFESSGTTEACANREGVVCVIGSVVPAVGHQRRFLRMIRDAVDYASL